jgi:hypothetical protein
MKKQNSSTPFEHCCSYFSGMRHLIAGLLAIGLLSNATVQAQLMGYESFSYTNGASLTGQKGGSGWLGAWTAGSGTISAFTVGEGLTYPGFSSSGNAIQDASGSEFNNGRQWFDPDTTFTNGTTIWFSCLVKYNINHNSDLTIVPFGKSDSKQNGYGVTVNCRPAANLSQDGSPRAYIRADGSNLGIGASSSGAGLTGATTNGTPILVVGRFVLSTSSNSDTLDIWVNQTSEPVGNSSLRLTGFTAFRSASNSDGKLLVYSGYSSQGSVDEIAIGHSYADVTANLIHSPTPTIVLTAPTNEAIYEASSSITLTTDVTANGHTVNKVQYFNNDITLLGEATSPPYSYTWVNAPAGEHKLSARLVYDGDLTQDSAASNIYVFANTPAVITVNVQSNRTAISPHIYGVNNISNPDQLNELNYTINRRGGEVETRYNWKLDAHNICKNWYFISMGPKTFEPSGNANRYIQATFDCDADVMITIPTIGWMPKLKPDRGSLWSYSIEKYGPQTGHEPYGAPDAGNGISVTNNTRITWNDPNDANFLTNSSYQAEWVHYLTNRWGTASNGGVRFYTLDNEPGLWDYVHRDVRPDGVTTNEIRDYSYEYGAMIKEIDPDALICGPNDWGWLAWWKYYPWFLAEMKKYEDANGVRILDYLTLNYYAGTRGAEGSIEKILSRNRSTRTLWDTDYADEGITWASAKVGLVRTMKRWVAENYPGTKIGVTEYNYGRGTDGALAQADVLGIFGREGMDLATRWGSADNDPDSIVFKAMKMYRNYDNLKSTFGDISVLADLPNNPDETSAFAAQRTNDNAVTVMFINKQLIGEGQVTVVLTNFVHAGVAQVWQLTDANVITRQPDISISGTSFTTTVPKQSITLFVVDSGVPIIAGAATLTSPVNNATGVSVTPALSWVPGTNAVDHFIYIGTSSNAVATATTNSPEFAGITKDSSFTPDPLSYLTPYYWRVDTRGNATPTPSAVWSFTTTNPPPFQSIYVNFQPSGATPVANYLVDGGATYASRNGQTYGWNADHSGLSRDRGVNTDQLLDTLIHFQLNGFWEIAVPNGPYQVKVSIGDAGNSSTHTINVEGVNYWNARSLSANVFENATKLVTVSDGKLTVDQGSAADKSTRINYIEIYAGELDPPTGLKGVGWDHEIQLSWNASPEATSYNLKRSSSAGGPYTLVTNTTSLSVQDSGLATETTYYYVVSSANGTIEGSNSAPVAATTRINLALNRPATSSSNENASNTPDKAVDGNHGSRWASSYTDPNWLRVDLGTIVDLDSMRIHWETAYSKAYQLQVSNNGTDWQTFYSTSSGSGGTEVFTNLTTSGRYVRMYGTQRATTWGHSIWELEVYGSISDLIGPATNPNPANGATDVVINPTLSWTAGHNASSHRIFFGANSNAVAAATTSSPEFKGALAATSYAPGTLASSGRFFWRVDEVGDTSTTNGPIWTFATLIDTEAKTEISGSYDGTFSISFPGQTGQKYRVERSDSLLPVDWQTISNNIHGTGVSILIDDPDTTSTTQRYYRVHLLAP